MQPRGGPQTGICNGVQKSLERIGSTPQGHTCPELLWQPRKAGKYGTLAGVAACGRSQKWGCRGRLALGFKPRCGSHERREPRGFGKVWSHEALGLPLPHSLGSWKARCSSNAELSLSSLEECRRDTAGRKGVKVVRRRCHMGLD